MDLGSQRNFTANRKLEIRLEILPIQPNRS
jgi:hypothetical protein